jgi:outer membrane protein OmpA-like peptidoglycan-associated protein
MRILRARFVLPARMKNAAALDARQIADAVAQALAAQGSMPGGRIAIEIQGNSRPVRHMAADLASATGRAVQASRRRV